MAGAPIAPAIIGGCIGVAGALSGTAMALVLGGRREARATALETAEKVAAIEEQLWSLSPADGPNLLAQLRQLDVRLRSAKVLSKLRVVFMAVTYSCWRAAAESSSGGAATQIPQDLLMARGRVEAVVLADVLAEGKWWRRRRNRRNLLAEMANHSFIPPPTTLLGRSA